MHQINKRIIWMIVGLVGVIMLTYAPVTYAEDLAKSGSGDLGLDLKGLISKLAFVNTFMHVIILITLNFTQYLLQSDFFTNPAMMGALNKIWQLSRDIMNVIFALMLIGVALYTIVTADKKYVTDKLQTFVIAVILVNFSWFFPRVIIDVANVLTATIYTIPDVATSGLPCMTWNVDGKPIEPCKALISVKILPGYKDKSETLDFCLFEDPIVPLTDCHCYDIACYKVGPLAALKASGNAGAGHVMINALVVNFVKILDMPKIAVSVEEIGDGTTRTGFFATLKILMVIGMSFLFQLAIVLPLIGLTIGLLIRILIIWITTAFMPFAFLGYVINGKLGTNVFEFEQDIWKEFLVAAFMPAVVAVPITIGFIMLTAASSIPAPTTAMPMTLGIPMFVSVQTWWAMMWQMAAIVIVWTGSFAALGRSKIIGKMTDKLKSFGDGIFSTMVKLPLIAPLPMPGGRNLASFYKPIRNLQTSVRQSVETGRPLKELMEEKNSESAPGMNKAGLTKLMNTETTNAEKVVTAINEINRVGTTAAAREPHIQVIKDLYKMTGATELQVIEKLQEVVSSGKLEGVASTTFDNNGFKDALSAALVKINTP